MVADGDSLIDVAGQRSIGHRNVMKLGADDWEYQAWLAPHLKQLQRDFEEWKCGHLLSPFFKCWTRTTTAACFTQAAAQRHDSRLAGVSI